MFAKNYSVLNKKLSRVISSPLNLALGYTCTITYKKTYLRAGLRANSLLLLQVEKCETHAAC